MVAGVGCVVESVGCMGSGVVCKATERGQAKSGWCPRADSLLMKTIS